MRLSLEEAMVRWETSVFQAALVACGNRQDAEDAAQETFVAYYKSTRQFEDAEHIRAWLLRVAINKGRSFARAFWRRNRQSIDDYAETLAFEEPVDSDLFRAVMALPEKYRVPIHLFYYEESTVKEIGALLRAKENTVLSWLRRGRLLLKEQLQEGWQDDEP